MYTFAALLDWCFYGRQYHGTWDRNWTFLKSLLKLLPMAIPLIGAKQCKIQILSFSGLCRRQVKAVRLSCMLCTCSTIFPAHMNTYYIQRSSFLSLSSVLSLFLWSTDLLLDRLLLRLPSRFLSLSRPDLASPSRLDDERGRSRCLLTESLSLLSLLLASSLFASPCFYVHMSLYKY